MGNDVLDSPKKRRAYQPFGYVINVTNTGTERLTDLDLVDEVESQGPVFLDVSEQCVDATIYNQRNVACGILRLEPGETVIITITMCAAEPVHINNTAELRGGKFFDILGSDSTVTEVVGDPTACPTDFDTGPDPGPFPGGGVGGDGKNDPADPDSTLVDVYALSFEASQDADIDQDSGDVDLQMEGSPGGAQDANTGNFAAPYQDRSIISGHKLVESTWGVGVNSSLGPLFMPKAQRIFISRDSFSPFCRALRQAVAFHDW